MQVIRDTSTGVCFTTDYQLDEQRLAELGYEIAGALDEDTNPSFTTCEHEGCGNWIMLDPVEDSAPEYCTNHQEENE